MRSRYTLLIDYENGTLSISDALDEGDSSPSPYDEIFEDVGFGHMASDEHPIVGYGDGQP
jgi:hypothetical protein